MLKYDEPKILDELGALPNFARVAFAAACAERQMADYARVATNLDTFKSVASALDCIWNELLGVPTRDETLTRHLSECMSALPQPESPEGQDTDAITSTAYAIRARLTGVIQEAAWAARHAFDNLYFYLTDPIPSKEFTPEAEQRVLAHPLIQAELQRQRRDLSDLTELVRDKGNLISTILRLRARAKEAAQHFTVPVG